MPRFVAKGAQPWPRLRCYPCMSSHVLQSAGGSSILRPFVWIAVLAFALGFAGYVALAPRGEPAIQPAIMVTVDGSATEA